MCLQLEVQTSLVFSCVIYMMVYSGSCTDYTMDCDSGTQPLTGTVDTSLLDGTNCFLGAVDKVIFKIVYPNGDEVKICTVPYPECNQDSNEKNGQMCWCESSSGNTKTYQLKFCFEESYANTKLRITTNCAPVQGKHVFTYTDCDTPDSSCSEEEEWTTEKKIGVGVGVGCLVLIIVIIVVVCVCEKKGHCGCCCQCFHSLCSRCCSSSSGAKPKPDVPV